MPQGQKKKKVKRLETIMKWWGHEISQWQWAFLLTQSRCWDRALIKEITSRENKQMQWLTGHKRYGEKQSKDIPWFPAWTLEKPLTRIGNTRGEKICLFFNIWHIYDSRLTHIQPDILGVWSQVGLRKHHYEQR